jgi:hypothetical protein
MGRPVTQELPIEEGGIEEVEVRQDPRCGEACKREQATPQDRNCVAERSRYIFRISFITLHEND